MNTSLAPSLHTKSNKVIGDVHVAPSDMDAFESSSYLTSRLGLPLLTTPSFSKHSLLLSLGLQLP